MGKFYSDTLDEALRILYFQADESRWPRGVELLQTAVDAGEPDACYFLARCYAWEDGGVAEDMQRARALSRQGIEAGSDLCVLGADRFNGLTGDVQAAMKGTLEDAFHGAVRQAEAGDPMAQYAVALFYYWEDISALQRPASQAEYDKNEKKNALEAIKWYRKAAEQGCIPAFRNHYACLAKGTNGAPHDEKAALRFVEDMKNKVDIPLHFYQEFAWKYQDMDQDKDALRWLEAGAAKDDRDCTNNLGEAYRRGLGVKEDDKKAFALYQKAEALGEPYGSYNLGQCYLNGWGTAEDEHAAIPYFQRSALAGVLDAVRMLAVCNYYGYGTPVDYNAAFTLATEAMEKGSGGAIRLVGRCYLYGQGTPQNFAAARQYLEPEAEAENDEALFLMGQMYDRALGVPEDVERAVAYYQKAVEEGSDEAEEALAHFKKSILGKWKRR